MPLTESEKRKVRDGITRDVRDFFQQADSTSTTNEERSSFLAGPPPSSPLRRIGWEAGRQACRRWAAGRGPSIEPWRDLFTRDICEPYIENEFGPLGDGTAAPPFEGGQCDITYVVGTKGTDCPTGPSDVAAFTSGPGPVSAITQQIIPNDPFPGQFRFIWTVTFSDGDRTFTLVRLAATPEPCVRVFPADPAVPDDCGNLPDEWTPGTGPTIPPETGPIPDPPGWPIPDFDIDITVDPDGTIKIDFGDGDPPEEIDPGSPAGDGGPPALPPGSQGDAGAGAEAGDNDAEGEAPPGQVLVGLRLQLIEEGPRPKVFAGGVYRGAAFVYMGGDVSLDQDFAGSLLIDDQFVYAERENLTRWRVMANAGFRWGVTPYYRDAE